MKTLSMIGLFAVALLCVSCGGSPEITVGSGTTPTYTWDSGPVRQLTVIRGTLESGTTIWAIGASGDEIASPVTHGTVPSGATELTQAYTGSPEPVLTAGADYQVWLERGEGERVFVDFTAE
ncbi:MAG: hypothetical protein P1V51_02525 [Deltaproteobacteria bacterium]|nr:hypothetical protein [Deltaproteobacteria bacterium]